MNNGRRVELDVTYNNAPLAGQVGAEIESLTYVDNAADDSDSIDITLDAQDSKWLHGWLPEEGATLRPRIIGRDWNGPGDTHVMECGLFILDDVAYQDAPTTLQVGGVSKPSDTDFSELERETIWKNTSIKRIGESIAGRYGLGFTYDADDYDIECDEQDGTDSSYYNTICKNYGLILKVYAKRLWVYDRERYKGKRAVQDFDRTNIMKIIEKNEGKKINYNLTGTKLDFADGALTLDLARYQQDDPVTRDIMVDSEGYLTTGRGLYYAAQVEIPARKYTETVTTAQETDAQAEGGENTEGMSRETVTRTPEPLDTEDVTLYLFAIDGIMIH